MHGLVNHFFDNADDEIYGKNILASLRIPIDISSSFTMVIISPLGQESCRVVHSMAVWFKREERFRRREDEDVAQFIGNYEEEAVDYDL